MLARTGFCDASVGASREEKDKDFAFCAILILPFWKLNAFPHSSQRHGNNNNNKKNCKRSKEFPSHVVNLFKLPPRCKKWKQKRNSSEDMLGFAIAYHLHKQMWSPTYASRSGAFNSMVIIIIFHHYCFFFGQQVKLESVPDHFNRSWRSFGCQ